MSKARELASLLSNSADLSDGASTGGEFKFTASGAIEANKALIKKSDNTVEQIKISSSALSSALSDRQYVTNVENGTAVQILDILIDGDYVFLVTSWNVSTSADTIRLQMYSVDSNNLVTLEQENTFDQVWNRFDSTHRAWITKTSTANKYVLSIFDSDQSLGDGRISSYGIVNNLDGTYSYSTRVSTVDAAFTYGYPRQGTRPVQMGDYIVFGVTIFYSSGLATLYNELFSIDTSGAGTAISIADSGNEGILPTADAGDPDQRILVKSSESTGYLFKSNADGTIEYEYFSIGATGQITDGGAGTLASTGLLSTSIYNEFDIVWSSSFNHYVVLTNNSTTTRVAIYNSSLQFVHARDYVGVGRSQEFYRSLQIDESNNRFYLVTCNDATEDATFITGTVTNNKVYFFEDETLTLSETANSGHPMLSLDEANGKIVYAYHGTDVDLLRKAVFRFVSAATGTTSNILNGTVIGFSKESASDGEYVTVAVDGGGVSLSGLTADTIYFVDDDGSLITSGDNTRCIGKALTPTDLRIDTQRYLLDPGTLGTVGESKVVTSDSSGNVQFSDNDQIKFGTDNDAQIYHNGSGFYLNNTTGNTYLLGDSTTLIQGTAINLETPTGEDALYYDGTVLYGYYNGIERFRTDSGGMLVQGYVYATSGIAHGGDTDNRIIFGTDTQTFQTGGGTRMTINNVGDVDIANELTAGSYNESFSAVLSSSNATTVNCEVGNSFSHTLTENTTFTFSNPPASGTAYSMSIEIIQDASASGYTVTWPTSVDWPAATAPTLTATASAVDVFVFTTRDGGTTWYGFTAGQALG